MQQFDVVFRSFQDVQDFVFLAISQPFEIFVGNDWQMVNAKSLMMMFSVDYTRPLKVSGICTAEEFLPFREAALRFQVS